MNHFQVYRRAALFSVLLLAACAPQTSVETNVQPTLFSVTAPGEVDANAGVGGPAIPLHRPAGFKWFDSLGVEEGGNICVATIGEGGITVVAPTGEPVEFVPTPDPFTTNICWGGADQRTAFITLSGSGRLVSCRWLRPGLALAY